MDDFAIFAFFVVDSVTLESAVFDVYVVVVIYGVEANDLVAPFD